LRKESFKVGSGSRYCQQSLAGRDIRMPGVAIIEVQRWEALAHLLSQWCDMVILSLLSLSPSLSLPLQQLIMSGLMSLQKPSTQ
jgi:hypothetical protein